MPNIAMNNDIDFTILNCIYLFVSFEQKNDKRGKTAEDAEHGDSSYIRTISHDFTPILFIHTQKSLRT